MTLRNASSLVALFAAGTATCFLALHRTEPGLPHLSDEHLADMTWRALVANEGLERWRDAYRRTVDDGTMPEDLVDVRLDEIRREGDKAFVSWRLVESPPPEEEGFIRLDFWVDVRTEKIVYEETEVHEDR